MKNLEPVILMPADIMKLAIFFRKSPSEIREKTNGKIYFLYSRSEEKYLFLNGYKTLSDYNVYYKDKDSAICVKTMYNITLYQVYLLLDGREDEIYEVRNYVEKSEKLIDYITNKFSFIEQAYQDIAIMLKDRKPYSPFKYEEIQKIAKQMKIGFAIENDALKGSIMKFDLGKIVCGDEEEGYINYQNISVWLDKRMKLIKIGYKFRKWEYISTWGFMSDMHPHVNGSSLCFGNRKEDVIYYKANEEWGLMLATFRECFASYYPNSAYCKIKDIASLLRFMNNHSGEIEYPSHLVTDEEKSKWYYNHIKRMAKRCRHCDNSYYTEECDREDCVGNPKTEKLCPTCDTKMVWDAHSHSLKCSTCYVCPYCHTTTPNSDHCKNIECSNSPLYQPLCRYCDGRIVNGYCTNDKCAKSKNYEDGLIKFKTPSVCMLCGKSLIQNEITGNYYCPNHTKSHYNKYGQNIMMKNKDDFQDDLRARHVFMQNNRNTLPCNKCYSSSLNLNENNDLMCRCSTEPLGKLGSIIFNGITFNKIIWKGEIPYGTELEESGSGSLERTGLLPAEE